jgi:hypothetical protein
MATTAAHSKLSFSTGESGVGHESSTPSGAPGPGPAAMPSVTSPVISPDSPQSPFVEPGAKAAAGKKKRKREPSRSDWFLASHAEDFCLGTLTASLTS